MVRSAYIYEPQKAAGSQQKFLLLVKLVKLMVSRKVKGACFV